MLDIQPQLVDRRKHRDRIEEKFWVGLLNTFSDLFLPHSAGYTPQPIWHLTSS